MCTRKWLTGAHAVRDAVGRYGAGVARGRT